MTKAELIEILEAYPDDMRVLLDGYEGGYLDIPQIFKKKIWIDFRKKGYSGPHESHVEAELWSEGDEIKPPVECIVISRYQYE